MLHAIKIFNKKHQLFFNKNKLILAVSGGIDSMVLLDLLSKFNIEITVAHCNFKLRGSDSDKDQELVKEISLKYKRNFETINFETEEYAATNKLSIQEAARNLRYNWFEKLRIELKANLIVTAHHLNDNTETLLYNIAKGTGLKGLRGMKPKNDKLIRPLLEISRLEIEKYASDNEIKYREDKSNASLKYNRNLIRKKLVPEFENVNSSFFKTQKKHFERFREIELFHNDVIERIKGELFEKKKENYYISINKLLKYRGYKTLLYEILSTYGYSNMQVEDVLNSIDKEKKSVGKTFFSKTYRLIKDRKHLILTDLSIKMENIFIITGKETKIELPNNEIIRIHEKPIKKLTKISKKAHFAYIDKSNLEFPLILRRKKDGDYFYPFGMNSKSGKRKKKKFKKYFTDLKFSEVDKENVWVLTSGEKIVWLVNQRIDDRFKVTENTKDVLQFNFLECKN